MKQLIGDMKTVIAEDNFLLRYATAIAISAVTIIMLMSAIIFYEQGKASNIAKNLVVHTYEVTGHIQLMFNRLKDVDLGERGFILSGEEKYLDPYHDALKDSPGNDERIEQHHSIAQELAILRKLTSDNPVQQQNLDEMASYFKELLDYWEANINARRHQDARKTGTRYDFSHGKELMDDTRRLVSIMQAEENRLLDIRTRAEENSTRQNELVIFFGIALFYTMQVLAIWLYQHSRARARTQLLRYTRELEEREEELKMQQEELKASNEEIESSNEELEEKTRALEEQNAQIQMQSEELTESQCLLEEKAKELELASKYKSEFLANMSHELRTPLNSLLILARLLAANEEHNLTPSQIEDASIIYNSGLELLSLINDILDLSKIEAGKLTFSAEETSLDGIVKRLQQQFAPIAKQAGVAFPVTLAGGLPATLHTDAHRVEQILKNLLSNAFKFTSHGSVTLKVHLPDGKTGLQRSTLGYDNSIAF